MLAEGPERMVSTGLSRVASVLIRLPSLRTTITGALQPRARMSLSATSMKSWMTGRSFALSSAVAPRWMTSMRSVSSFAQMHESPKRSRSSDLKRFSQGAPVLAPYSSAAAM